MYLPMKKNRTATRPQAAAEQPKTMRCPTIPARDAPSIIPQLIPDRLPALNREKPSSRILSSLLPAMNILTELVIIPTPIPFRTSPATIHR